VKVVFLDIDGVLNSQAHFRMRNAGRESRGEPLVVDMSQWKIEAIDPVAVRRLNRLHEATGCVYVLSSTWRILESLDDMQALLEHHGFTGRLIDKTTHDDLGDHTNQRGLQCAEWLSRHPEVTGFVCIDDDSDFANMRGFLVRTRNATGLLDEHVDLAIQRLGGAS